jgi:S-(hydroxymethyl)mycothiol dehydrogenase
MPQPAPGIVSHKKGEPVSVKTVAVAEPDRGAMVQIHARRACHADLHYREGGITDEFRLGHEVAGDVEQVGQSRMERGEVLRSVVML